MTARHMSATCACGRPMTVRRQRCRPCYEAGRANPSQAVVEARFWGHVAKGGPGDCWTWTAGRAHGYGRAFVHGRYQPAHRVAYGWVVGAVPEDLQMDHLCRNPSCVNPAHLEPVTPRENTLRGISPSALAAKRSLCPEGHPLDGRKGEGRYCLTCNRARNRLWYASHRAALGEAT